VRTLSGLKPKPVSVSGGTAERVAEAVVEGAKSTPRALRAGFSSISTVGRKRGRRSGEALRSQDKRNNDFLRKR
jgi:hypothetical protein